MAGNWNCWSPICFGCLILMLILLFVRCNIEISTISIKHLLVEFSIHLFFYSSGLYVVEWVSNFQWARVSRSIGLRGCSDARLVLTLPLVRIQFALSRLEKLGFTSGYIHIRSRVVFSCGTLGNSRDTWFAKGDPRVLSNVCLYNRQCEHNRYRHICLRSIF